MEIAASSSLVANDLSFDLCFFVGEVGSRPSDACRLRFLSLISTPFSLDRLCFLWRGSCALSSSSDIFNTSTVKQSKEVGHPREELFRLSDVKIS